MIYFIYICHIHLITGTYERIIDQLPTTVASWLSCMVRASHRYREVTGSNPIQVLVFFFSGFLRNTPFPEKIRKLHEVRLNSPRGKFKITNMADDQVDVTPEDIPGASFIEEKIEKLTVSQLKFWLKCLRINQNCNEKELLES